MKFHEETCRRARDLMRRKNSDYSDDRDCFGNLSLCESMNLCTTEQGILIRMSDKLRRCCSLSKRDPKVKDESFEDSLIDIINYAILCIARRRVRTHTEEPSHEDRA